MIRGLNDMCLTLKDKRKIEKKANDFLGSAEEENGIIDIIAFARSKGFEVFLSELPGKNEDGVIYVDMENGEEKTKKILISNELKYPAARFIIAHELGHYVLHYDRNDMSKQKGKVFFHVDTHENKAKEEQEADYFAACLLMPQKTFKNKYEELNAKMENGNVVVNMLSQIFIVEPNAVSRRIPEVYEDENKQG